MARNPSADSMISAQIKIAKVKLVAFFDANDIDPALAGSACFSLFKDITRSAGHTDLVDKIDSIVNEFATKEGESV